MTARITHHQSAIEPTHAPPSSHEDVQVVTYLVRVTTYGKRAQVKEGVGRTLAKFCALAFTGAEVWPVSKPDVPRRKPIVAVERWPVGDQGE